MTAPHPTVGAHAASRSLAQILARAFVALSALLAAALAGQILATQYVASQFGYPEAFDRERIAAGIYQPFAWLGPWRPYSLSHNPSVHSTARNIATSGTGAGAALVALIGLSRRRKPKSHDSLHGSAHWASEKDLIQTNLIPRPGKKSEGVFVGGRRVGDGTQYLRHSGPEHLIAFAPTRSGKGVGLVIPTLLTWNESALIHDPKGEAWALTAGWRSRAGGRAIRFDPGSPQSAGFNPLAEIRLHTPHAVADAQNIATMIVDTDGRGLYDHWRKTAQSLLVGCILHSVYTDPDASLYDVADVLSRPNKEPRETFEEILATNHDAGDAEDAIARSFQGALNMQEKELSSVISTAASNLSLYQDPLVAANTDHSDFAISDLMNSEQPVSLYLVVRPSDQERMRPLIRLMVSQIILQLTREMQFKDGRSDANYKHRLLLLLDEFAALRKLSVVEDGLAIMAGYGLKAYLIVQDLQQLTRAYGREEAIMGNCHIRIAFAPNKIETADLISRMTGRQTVVRTRRSLSGKRRGSLSSVSESFDEVGRSLLTPDEVMRLPGPEKDRAGNITRPGDMLIFVAGSPPIYGQQVLYFRDEVLSARSKVAAPDA